MPRHSQASIQPSPARSPSRGRDDVISRSAAKALGQVLNALRDGWFLEKRLRNVARMIVEEAHRHHLDADQMLMALREEWPKVLERRRVPDKADLEMVVERLSVCCRVEFYSVAGRGLR
jgi:hypothetical protein